MARLVFLLSLAVLLAPGHARATSYIPEPWQLIVEQADLAGIVECVTAGEIVSEYRIVESWRGPKAGTVVRTQGCASVWEPSLPIALVGDRSLVAAWKWRSDFRLISGVRMGYGPGGSIPEWWRESPAEFVIASPLGMSGLPARVRTDQGWANHLLGGYADGLSSFRKEVKSFLALSDEAREAAVLRSMIDWHVIRGPGGTFHGDPIPARTLEARAASSRVDSIVTAVIAFAKTGDRSGSAAMHVLHGGGRYTLASLTKYRDVNGDFQHSLLTAEISLIRRRLGLDPPENYNPIAIPPRPSPLALTSMRVALHEPTERTGSQDDYRRAQDQREAFEVLTVYDPDAVADYLMTWYPTDNNFEHESDGYGMASYFAWRCTGDRASYFRRLLQAQDGYVRAVAAIYLRFEDEEAGTAALRGLVAWHGDVGALAALSLARRGDKGAVDRALEVFQTAPGATVWERLHINLQKRLLVLFSNSAKSSGVPQPDHRTYASSEEDQYALYMRLKSWWSRYGPRLTLRDPSLAELETKKIE